MESGRFFRLKIHVFFFSFLFSWVCAMRDVATKTSSYLCTIVYQEVLRARLIMIQVLGRAPKNRKSVREEMGLNGCFLIIYAPFSHCFQVRSEQKKKKNHISGVNFRLDWVKSSTLKNSFPRRTFCKHVKSIVLMFRAAVPASDCEPDHRVTFAASPELSVTPQRW